MDRTGLPLLLAFALALPLSLAACDGGEPTTTPEPEPAPVEAPTPAESDPEPAPEPEPAPAAEPEPAAEAEFHEAEVSKDGFAARHLDCKLNDPVAGGRGFVIAGLSKQKAAFDACAPKGAFIDVEWAFVSNATSDISVVAEKSQVANCVAQAFSQVRAGVGHGTCKVTLLVGDTAAAAAAYDAR